MERAVDRLIDGYTERHHVIPRCLGGSDVKSNIVILTAEEHYLAHLLLVKMNPDNHGLVRAAMMMSGQSSRFLHRSNKFYGWLRRKHSVWMKNRNVSRESIEKGAAKNRLKVRTAEFKAAVGAFHTGRTRPPETGKKISAAAKKRMADPKIRAAFLATRPKLVSSETRAKMSANSKGRRHSEETKARMRAAKLGKTKSDETRRRMSAARKRTAAAKRLARSQAAANNT